MPPCSMAASPPASSKSNMVGAVDASESSNVGATDASVAADASDTRFDNTLELRVAIGSSTGWGNKLSGGMRGMFSQAKWCLET